MNLCTLPEKESPARIGLGDNLATSANDDTQFCWVVTDKDRIVDKVFVSLHASEQSARKRMLSAARGYMDKPMYEYGDLDDSMVFAHWENRFWVEGVCAVDVERKEIHQ